MRMPPVRIQADRDVRRDRDHEERGPTVIKAALAMASVSIAVVVLMVTLSAAARASDAGKELSQAVALAEEIHEWTLHLPFSGPDPGQKDDPSGRQQGDPRTSVDDLGDLMDATFCPPRNANGSVIAGMADWSQRVAVTWREASSLSQTVAPGSSDIVHVDVIISHNGKRVFRTSWLVARRD